MFQRVDREDFATWSLERRFGLAELILSAAPDFYAMIPLPHDEVLGMITGQVGVAGTELGETYVLGSDHGVVLASFSVLDPARIASAMREGALGIIRGLRGERRAVYMKALSTYGCQVEPMEAGGLYCSRLGVAPQVRGQGLGARAAACFLALDGVRERSLHVHCQNAPAIALYRKLGFDFQSQEGYRFRAMILSRAT